MASSSSSDGHAATRRKGEILTLDDFKVVKKAVFKARRKWKPMGIELGISVDDLDNIEDTGRDNEECLQKLLEEWLRRRSLCPTWDKLVEALQAIGREDVADEVAEKFVDKGQDQLSPMVHHPSRSLLYRCTLPSSRAATDQRCLVVWSSSLDLSLIEREEVEEGLTGKELVRLTMEGRVREVLEKRTPVELKDLFKLDQEDRKVILIEGPPGSGKTSLSWHICQEWEAGRLFSEFNLIVYVQLRDLAIQAAQSIADLLPRRDNEMAQNVFSELKAKGGEGVLFILDGWDELPGDLPPHSPPRRLVESGIECPLERSGVIVTSRPEASTKLHDLATSRVQIVGFTPEKAKAYFTECLKHDSQATKVLMDTLEENPVVESSCYIPLNAAIIVTLFIALGHQLPPTLTGVFVSLITYCILRHCKGRTDIKIRSLSSLDNLPPALQPSFDSLCALAFQGILVNQITFSEKECMIYPEFATLSLLQAVEGFLDMGLTRTYNFLHLSIQELLAARHMSKLPADSQIEIVQCLLDDDHERFPGVFRFYAGITSLRTPGIEGIICQMVQRYKDAGSTLNQGQPLIELLLECLHEVQDPALYQVVSDEWGERCLSLTHPSPVACLSVGHLLPQLSPPVMKVLFLDDHCIMLLARGLSASQRQRKSGLSIHIWSPTLRGHDSLRSIAYLLSSSCTIRELVLEFTVSSIDPLVLLKCIGEAMATNTSVKSLTLGDVSLMPSDSPSGESPGPALREMLQVNKTLETLRFWAYQIGPHVSSIAGGLQFNENLKELQLRNCGVTDTGAKSLAEMLTNNTTLETLDICRNDQISAEGVNSMAEAVKTNSTLRVLKLDCCTVCDSEPLAVALTVNSTLESLDIDTGIVSRDVTEKLMANGVLQQLLMIAIERTVSEYGGEETGRALVAMLKEWRDARDSDWDSQGDSGEDG